MESPNELTLEEIKKQSEEYLAGWKRAQADYQNLKRETEKEKIEFAKYANEKLILDLLPVLDSLALALGIVSDLSKLSEEERKKAFPGLIEGLKATENLFVQSADRNGLKKILIEPGSPFDPQTQEAVLSDKKDGIESDCVIRVVQDGWKLGDKVIRPAKVIISK